MHYTVTLDVISTKIHVHVLLLIMCYKYTKITQVKYAKLFFHSVQPYMKQRMRPETLALLSQSDQEGAKQHIHFC